MSSFEVRVMEEDEFKALYNKHKVVVFEEDHSYDLWELLSESELDNFKSLGRDLGSPYKLYLGVFDDSDEFVGWRVGGFKKIALTSICVTPQFFQHTAEEGSIVNYSQSALRL